MANAALADRTLSSYPTYHGSTRDELGQVRAPMRIRALVDQSSLFRRHGEIELTPSTLTLGSWMTLRPSDIRSVRCEFIEEYTRFTAGGSRGAFPSLGVFSRQGAPLVLDVVDGRQIVLLIGFSLLPGTTKNATWFPLLTSFAEVAA